MTKIELLKKKCADFEKELKELFNAEEVLFDIAIDGISPPLIKEMEQQGFTLNKGKHIDSINVDLPNGTVELTNFKK